MRSLISKIYLPNCKKMVIFQQKETLEKELSSEEIEKIRLREIESSDAWKKHAALHSANNPARLHISGEPIFGEKDHLRERMGIAQKERNISQDSLKKDIEVNYGVKHGSPGHVSYVSAGSQPDLWGSCDCGAEFKAEKKGNKFEVKSYGVVGSDIKATSYLVSNTSTASYSGGESFSGYQKSSSISYG